MSQKPIAMDHLKQILQLKRDGVAIKEIVRRTGFSSNSVRKYLSKLSDSDLSFTNKELTDAAYNNEQLLLDVAIFRAIQQSLKEASWAVR